MSTFPEPSTAVAKTKPSLAAVALPPSPLKPSLPVPAIV
jgi:hypothetical protein